MKLVRYLIGSTEYRGVLDGDTISRIHGSFFHSYEISNDKYNINNVKILPPILPSKVIGFRKNYKSESISDIPLMFLKPPTSVISAYDDILYPENIDSLHLEIEVALVISRKARFVKVEHAKDYILGYTVANDITARNSKLPESYTEGKCYDTTTPLGVFIDTTFNIDDDIAMVTKINNQTVQSGKFADIHFSPYELIAHASTVMTLQAGDIILTGTPATPPEVKVGDTVELSITGLGGQVNKVVKG